MEINMDKTFYVSMYSPHHAHAPAFWHSRPSPTPDNPWRRKRDLRANRLVKQLGPEEYWRYLGHYQNNLGGTNTTTANIHEVITVDLAHTASRPFTATGTNQAVNSLINSRIVYQTKHSSLTRAQIFDMQSKINQAALPGMRVCSTTSALLVHGHVAGGGLAFDHLWDTTNTEKLILLQELMQSDVPAAQAAGANFLYRLQCKTKIAAPPLTVPVGHYFTTAPIVTGGLLPYGSFCRSTQ